MGSYTMKTCALSGKRFRANANNFYRSAKSTDGLHSYSKHFDNFRRSTGVKKFQLQRMFNQLNDY